MTATSRPWRHLFSVNSLSSFCFMESAQEPNVYSHWVPGMRRITTAVLDTNQNASKMQMLAFDGEK